jgi:hypothetical protein
MDPAAAISLYGQALQAKINLERRVRIPLGGGFLPSKGGTSSRS